jgi:hypothetical protein
MGETVAPANPAQPILANTMNVTKVGGLAAIVTAVGAALSTALGQFDGERTAVVIAVIAAVTVAMVVAGYIAVTDLRVRNRQTIADNYLKYLSSRPALRGQNGQAHLMAPASSTFVKLIGREDDPVWQLLAVKVDVEADKQLTSFLAGNGVEKPSWFKEDEIRILAPS